MVGCYVALALAPGLMTVVLIRLVAGAAEATFVVGAYASVADIAPEARRGEAMSLVTLASYLGLTIGPVLAFSNVQFDLLWTGVIGGTLAYVLHRVQRTRGAKT